MGIDHIPHRYRKSFSLMGKVKSCLLKVLAELSLLNKCSLLMRIVISICVVYTCTTYLSGYLKSIKKSSIFPQKGCHSFLFKHIESYLLNMHFHWYSQIFTHRYLCVMGIDHIPHRYRKSFSLIGKVKSCLIKVLAELSLLNKCS